MHFFTLKNVCFLFVQFCKSSHLQPGQNTGLCHNCIVQADLNSNGQRSFSSVHSSVCQWHFKDIVCYQFDLVGKQRAVIGNCFVYFTADCKWKGYSIKTRASTKQFSVNNPSWPQTNRILWLHCNLATCSTYCRPIYIGKNQNPKNLGFLLYRLHCQKNP